MKKIIISLIIISTAIIVYNSGLTKYLNFEYVKSNLELFEDYYQKNPLITLISFFTIYVLTTALSLPGATILTLLAGALFGLLQGTILVSFASTFGATCAFLFSRFAFRQAITKRYKNKIKNFNEGIKKEGAFYLFTLRLIPIFPFFLINILMGLTPIKIVTFYLTSQLGMLPGTLVYVNAGLQLASLESLSGILSPRIILSFALLGVFPLIAKKIINYLGAKKVYKAYKPPKRFDYNMVVIGAGSAGLVTSYISAAVKAKVALIERHKMGGDCLNTGCVPSKAIIKSAKVNHLINQAKKLGFKNISTEFDFAEVMARVHKVIAKIEPHDSIARYSQLGVECITGEAKIISPWEVEVDGKVLTTKNITIATGARPFVPNIEGLESIPYLTSDTLWDVQKLPEKLLVIGGGPIGLEMAQSFARLGSKVSVIERGNRIMSKEDEDTSELVLEKLKSEGVNFILETTLTRFEKKEKKNIAYLKNQTKEFAEEFDQVLIAIGRMPNTTGFGLQELGIGINKNGTIEVNEFLQTKYPNIYACGDVAGPYQLTHMAAHQAWFCSVNALFGKFKKFKVDYSVVPWATYTDPEVATVGHTEISATEAELDFIVTKYGLDDLDRAIADDEDYGFVKVLTNKGTDRIIGATIVGSRASTMLVEFVTAMKYNIGLNKILGTIHVYPSYGEANKFVAGEWKKKTTNTNVFKYLKKFHQWSRS
jgi:dihydrolipoamide dehydrogenase